MTKIKLKNIISKKASILKKVSLNELFFLYVHFKKNCAINGIVLKIILKATANVVAF